MRTPPGLVAAWLALFAACGSPTATTASETMGSTGTTASTTEQPTTTGAPTCTPGEIVCLADDQQSVCDPDGVPGPPEACSGSCVAGEGCVCAPGETRCEGAEVQVCGEDFNWTTLEVCDEVQGLTCDPATKACAGACLPGELAKAGLTATGCEFYAVTTTQKVDDPLNGSPFAVVIENPGPADATITITQKETFDPVIVTVPAGAAEPIELPWVGQLTDTLTGQLVYDGAYRLQSDRPVRAIQYSTLEPAGSTDSSLLWPRHTWGTGYFAATRESTPDVDFYFPGAWAIVSGDDDTMVTVTPRPGTKAKASPGIGVDGGGALKMSRGDVLQTISAEQGDVTGASISADKPVLVFGAHHCAFVPTGLPSCDHLEEAMLPTPQLGTLHVPVPPVRHQPDTERRDQVVRVIATDGPTDLMYDPPQVGVPTTIPGTGEFVELAPSDQLYALTTSKPVVVVQFMVGRQWDGDMADPSMLVTLPAARFHTTHYVHTLADWLPVDIDITAPAGATVTIDGAPVGGWVDVGESGYQVAHVRFDSDVGLAEIVGDQPIGVSVYATSAAVPTTSFWHSTGGLLAP